MRFPNAAKGVKQIFTAQVLALIASICGAVAGGFLTTAGADGSAGSEATAVIIGVVTLAAGMLVLISFILNLVGLNAARKDDQAFHTAFILTLVGIVIALVQSGFSSNTQLTSLFDTLNTICQLLISYFVIKGIMSLAGKLGKQSMVDRGSRVIKMVIAVWVVAIIAGLVGSFFSNNESMLAVAGIMLLVAGVVSIIAYFLYLGYLSRAKKMLN